MGVAKSARVHAAWVRFAKTQPTVYSFYPVNHAALAVALARFKGTSNNTRFQRFLSWLSGRVQRSFRGESPIGDRFDAWPASARSFARCHTDSTRERTQAGADAMRSSCTSRRRLHASDIMQ